MMPLLQGGYRGFYSKNTMTLTPKVVNDIHKRGGTFLCTSRGGHDTVKIVDSIQDRNINQVITLFTLSEKWIDEDLMESKLLFLLKQVYIIGGDGTQKGAYAIYEVIVGVHLYCFVIVEW